MVPAARRKTSSRPLLGIVFGVVAALLVFELALQAISFAVWWGGGREQPVGADSAAIVLCVGDSNTYGVGASGQEQAYPAQLEARLNAARGGEWRVVNAGRAGRNSRELLLALPRQLAQHRPDVVCVLVGTNDAWSLPGEVTDAELEDAGDSDAEFPIVWRTGRMLALMQQWWRDDAATAAEFAGRWHEPETGTELWIEATGRFAIGGYHMTWRRDGDGLAVKFPNGVERRATLRRDGEDLYLQADWMRREYRFAPGPLPEGARPADESLFRTARSLGPDDPGFDEEFEWACARIAESPTNAAIWRRLQDLRLEPAHWQRLEALVRAALADAEDARTRAVLLRGLCMAPGKPAQDRLAWSVEAACLDGMDGALVGLLPLLRVTAEEYEAAVDEFAPSAERRAELRGLWHRADNRAAGYGLVLERHLQRVAALVQAAGARLVLLDYPLRLPVVEEIVDRVAGAHGAERVRLGSVFEELLRERQRDELFVPDGHCNDAGYEVIADQVAAVLRQ